MVTEVIAPSQDIVFKADSYEQTVRSFIANLPGGELYDGARIENSNFRKLMSSLAYEMVRANLKIEEFDYNYDPQKTVTMIDDWELLVGIPDDCFKPIVDTPIETRRKWVIIKFALMNANTAQDWVFIAKYLGFDIVLSYGVEIGLLPLPLPFVPFASYLEAAFTIIVIIKGFAPELDVLPLPLPFGLSVSQTSILECILNKIKASNVFLKFVYED